MKWCYKQFKPSTRISIAKLKFGFGFGFGFETNTLIEGETEMWKLLSYQKYKSISILVWIM